MLKKREKRQVLYICSEQSYKETETSVRRCCGGGQENGGQENGGGKENGGGQENGGGGQENGGSGQENDGGNK